MNFTQKELIDKYLHGELPDGLRENLEERFFLDDDFHEEIQVAEMTLVDCYIGDAMSPAEKERFESGYLTSPERREELKKSALFHREISQLKVEKKHRESIFSFFPKFSLSFWQFAGTAAVLVITIGIIWLVVQKPPIEIVQGNQNTITPPPVNTPPQNDKPIVRGPIKIQPQNVQTPSNENEMTIVLSPGSLESGDKIDKPFVVNLKEQTKNINLELLLPEKIKGASFSIIVADEKGSEISTFESQVPFQSAQGKMLSVNLKTENFAEGLYKVSVSPTSDNLQGTIIYQFSIKKDK